jgi:hypothetical protein
LIGSLKTEKKMNLRKTRLHILSDAKNLNSMARTGVSLHCHTEHSKEMLDFVPHYAEKLPIISYFWKKERDRYIEKEGRGIDFSTAFWSPPLTARGVFEIEKKQLNDSGLEAIVSLSDHDSIDANLSLHESGESSRAPISLEWTVPFDIGFFHVGVHNLPKDRALEITDVLLGYTFNKENHSNARLSEIFSMLNEMPGVLVILNHPLWDIEMIGKERHEELLKDFIREQGRWIHAFEINGFRAWSENKSVIEMAEALGIPIATGGDRHGCMPNTVVNLTTAETFEEFVDEIRVDKRSEVVLMPEYRRPIHSRQLQSFAEILKNYPEFPEARRRWFDRVHFDVGDGHGLRPLSVHWNRGGPTWLRWAIWTLGVLGSPAARPAFSIARRRADRVPKDVSRAQFEIPDLSDMRRELTSEAA